MLCFGKLFFFYVNDGALLVCCVLDGVFAGKTGSIVGWGTVSEGGSTSAVPLQAHVPIYSTAQCRKFKYRPSEIGKNMICAGGNSKDSCQVCMLGYLKNNTI